MENIIEKMNAYQEVLSTMPTNNKKNIEKYNEKIDEILVEYQQYQNALLEEIKRRFSNETNIATNDNIARIKQDLNNYEMVFDNINTIKSSYEKSNLDKEVYKLGKFYKENLENVNLQIQSCINIFRNMGIEITDAEFESSPCAKEYMQVFLAEMRNGNVNSDIIKRKFEEIFWRCPDIIVHIEVSMNNIYLKHQKEIDRFFEQRKEDTLRRFSINEQALTSQYQEEQRQLDILESTDKKILIDKFLSGELNIKDFEEEKIDKILKKFVNSNIVNQIEQNDVEAKKELSVNIVKFINSINEYKYYLKYKFILDSIREKYKVREENKNKVKENIKEIEAMEKKISRTGLFGKKDVNISEVNETYVSMKEKYREVSKNAIYNKIAENLTDNSSILDVFKFAGCFYKFLVDEIIDEIKGIPQNEIDQFIDEFINNIKSPYFTIINNIKILENKDIALIIKDRYKLLNFNIEKSDLSEDNLDNIIKDLEKLKIKDDIEKAGLTINQIKSICEYEKILNK